MSLPLKMMYSKMSSRGGMGRSVGRSSVPKERTGGWGGGGGENVNVLCLRPCIATTFIRQESEHSTFHINRGGTCFGSVTMLLIVGQVKQGCARSDVTVRARH